MKINRISPDTDEFLQRTAHIAKKPKYLYFIGKLPTGTVKTVAIVGTRRPTTYGRDVTRSITTELASAGVIVVSGMALGVDAIAHTAALDAGGITLAVLPSGVDTPYPKTNHALARRILEQDGALISEYEPGTEPRLYHFPERNRIVSALADVVIVTEASAKSGTMGTVAYALEQGKTVFAVPGNITSPLSAGCNNLIQQGASILIRTQDVLDELGIGTSTQQRLVFGDDEHEAAIIRLLQAGIQDGETLHLQSKLSASQYNQTMTMLEIKNIIRPLGANQWTLGS